MIDKDVLIVLRGMSAKLRTDLDALDIKLNELLERVNKDAK